MARLLGEKVSRLSTRTAAERAVQAVQRLNGEIGIPMRLRDLGVREDELRPMAEDTAQITRLLAMNPRSLDVDSLGNILHRAW